MTGFLLDTNVPSELISARPELGVSRWVFSQPEPSLFLSAISIGELRRGIVLLPPSRRRTILEEWLVNDLVPRFSDRILPVTQQVADRWGILDAQRQRRGSPLNTADGLIAATAFEYDLTLVTRNVKDFEGLDISLLDPWYTAQNETQES